jgi:hypothetical protein
MRLVFRAKRGGVNPGAASDGVVRGVDDER